MSTHSIIAHTFLPDTNRTRLVRKAHPTASFFNFFSPPVPLTNEDIENGEYDNNEILELEEKLEIDYQIGEDLKEKVCLLFSRLEIKINADSISCRSSLVL